MKKDRYVNAWNSMVKLRNNPIQVARDIYYIHSQLEIEKEIMSQNNYVTRFTQLFTIPRVRRANLAAFTVMIAQQMCGINIIAFYSTTVFVEAGYDDFQALLASFGFGLVNWVFAFPAFWTIDTVNAAHGRILLQVHANVDRYSSGEDRFCCSHSRRWWVSLSQVTLED